MRKICLIFIINYSLLITNSYSQWITWQRTYGEQGTDYAYSVVQLPDDGFMAVGRKLNSANLIRTNKFGDTLWTRVYASGEFVCIQKTSDSNYIICSVAGNIFKVDINGNIIWSKPPYNSAASIATIKETCDKGFILVGDFDAGLNSYPYIIKVDSLGNFRWERTYNNLTRGSSIDIVQTLNGGYSSTGYDSAGAFILRTDTLGNQLWVRHYPGTGAGTSITNLGNAGFVVGGQRFGPLLFMTDSSGNLIWLKTYFSSFGGQGNCNSTVRTNDGGYSLTGTKDTLNNFNFFVYLIKTDSLGNEQWHKFFGFNDYDEGFNIRQTSDSGYIIAGIRETFNQGDEYLIKTDKNGYANPIGIISVSNQIPKEFVLHQNYPNPFNVTTKIQLQVPRKSYINIKVYDVLGRVTYAINESKEAGIYEMIFDASNYSSGIYFYRLESENFAQTKKMILIK